MKLCLIGVILVMLVSGCGGGGGDVPARESGYDFGYIDNRQVGGIYPAILAQPAPELNITRPVVEVGTGPKIIIDKVENYRGVAHIAGSTVYEGCDQVVYGRVFNVDRTQYRVEVFAETNANYIQPLYGSRILINEDGTWLAISHIGDIHALVSKADYSDAHWGSLIDGVSVLAKTQE